MSDSKHRIRIVVLKYALMITIVEGTKSNRRHAFVSNLTFGFFDLLTTSNQFRDKPTVSLLQLCREKKLSDRPKHHFQKKFKLMS